MMRALLLAAGRGERLRPVTDTIPKCLVPIHGRPLLEIWLDHLFETPGLIERVLINTHYLADQVEKFVSESKWVDRIDLVYEEDLLGTAGTLAANRAFFNNETAFVAHADNLTDFCLRKMFQQHASRPSGHCITMLSFETDVPQTCGILECTKDGTVVGFHEKVENPPGNLANAAVYIMESEVMEFAGRLPSKVNDISLDVIPHFLGRILLCENEGYHRDIGSIESLNRAHAEYSFHDEV